MIDLVPPSSSAATLLPFDPFTVDERSEAELDELPFGIICLDEEGTILRYNLAEARLARLDRNQVVGKNFFARVAPCTAGPGFEGRFREFARASGGQDVLRFDYLFDFKFGEGG